MAVNVVLSPLES